MSEMVNTDIATKYGTGRKTLKSYLMGLGLSLLLTLCSFVLVGKHLLPTAYIYVSISILAILQLIAQVIFFLRLNSSEEGKWSLMPFIFTIVIVGILVGGSLWIMINLNYNMVH